MHYLFLDYKIMQERLAGLGHAIVACPSASTGDML